MSWRIIQASIAGTSHDEKENGCDDECFAGLLIAPDGEELFLGIISDGAGSAERGGIGARLACDAGRAVIEEWVSQAGSISSITAEAVTGWVEAIRQRICQVAESKELTPRDYACTLMGSVIGGGRGIFPGW